LRTNSLQEGGNDRGLP